MNGNVDQMLMKKIQKNSVARNGRPLLAVLRTHDLDRDLLLDGLVAHLGDVLQAARHHRLLAGPDVEQPDADDGRDERQRGRLVELVPLVLPEEALVLEELVDVGQEVGENRDHAVLLGLPGLEPGGRET